MLKELRKKNNLTQNELAYLCNVSIKTISRIENGDTKINYNTILKLANFFKVNVEEILKSGE